MSYEAVRDRKDAPLENGEEEPTTTRSRRRSSRSYSRDRDRDRDRVRSSPRRGRSRSRSPHSRSGGGRYYRDRSRSRSPPRGGHRDDRYREPPRDYPGPPPPRYGAPGFGPPPPDDFYRYRDYPPHRGPHPFGYGPPPPHAYDDRGPPRGPPFPPPDMGGRRGPPPYDDRAGPPPARRPRGERRRDEGPPGVSLLVRNVAPDIQSADLQHAFARIGELRDVYIPRDYHSNQPRGFAFIEFATPEQAREAREEMDQFPIRGRPIEVVFAQERRKTPTEMRGRVVNQQNRDPVERSDRGGRRGRSSSFEKHRQREQGGRPGDDETNPPASKEGDEDRRRSPSPATNGA
jgi:FUS-interacting serine-arginine-rich protein 1